MVRNGNGTKWLWYENDFHNGTKWLWDEMTVIPEDHLGFKNRIKIIPVDYQVHAACWYRKTYVFKTGKKTKKNIYMYIMLLCIIIYLIN
jgi:hypothetical protein